MEKTKSRTLILNFKNYPEILGAGALKLTLAAKKVGDETKVEMIIAAPTPFVAFLATTGQVPVFSQTLGKGEVGKSTGALIPEAIKGAWATGVLLNHSEARIGDYEELKELVKKCQKLELKICVCIESPEEAKSVAKLHPDYIAIEPKELIGTGISISTAKPELISKTAEVLRKAGFRGKILCGAGITRKEDVGAALKLGAQGILVSSSVVKAENWEAKLTELAGAMRE